MQSTSINYLSGNFTNIGGKIPGFVLDKHSTFDLKANFIS